MSSMYYPDISDHEWYSNGSVEDAGQPRRKSTVSGAVTSPDTAASNFGRDPYVATRGVEALRLEHTWQHSSSRGHEPLFIMSSPRSIFLLPSVPCQPTTPQWPVGDREQADSLLVELSESPPSAMKGDSPYDPPARDTPMPKTNSQIGTGWYEIEQDTSRPTAEDRKVKEQGGTARDAEAFPANSNTLGDLDMNQHGAWFTPTPDRPPTLDPEDLREAPLLLPDNTRRISNDIYLIDSVEAARFSDVRDEQEWDRCEL